jgi:hypothetical protein
LIKKNFASPIHTLVAGRGTRVSKDNQVNLRTKPKARNLTLGVGFMQKVK